MRVTNNSITNDFINRLQQISENLQDSTNQLSSGQRISSVSDDPISASRVLSFQSDQRNYEQYESNINRGVQISTVTYDSVDSLKDIIVRAEELAVGVDGVTSSEEYTAVLEEVNQLLEQAVDTANSKHAGQYIFAGNASDTEPYTVTRDANNDITAVAYAGSTNTSSFEISDGTTISPYSSGAQNGEIETVLNNLLALRDALVAEDSTAVSNARAGLESDEDAIINQLSSHAAVQARFETAQTQIDTYSDAIDERISGEADVDVAEATVRYNETYMAYQAALSAGSKMLSSSLLDYL